MKQKNWVIKNKKADFSLIAKNFGISETLAHLAVNRGIKSKEEMDAYLHPSFSVLADSSLLKDGERLCDILLEKMGEGKRIRIIGDYDVDGVMSTYLLYRGLTTCVKAQKSSSQVDYVIPERMKDGYGINIGLVEEAYQAGVDTIITCDNGISARDQVAYGKEKGMTLLITDHHDIPLEGGLPKADAVVNPKQTDCNYPFKELCGAAVVYRILELLYEKAGIEKAKWQRLTKYAAMATVCDVMDLLGENRAIVSLGLDSVRFTKNPGLLALLEACELVPQELTAYHIGFRLGPMINASGRLQTAEKGMQLFLSEDKNTAATLAKELRELNEERQRLTAEGVEEAIALVEQSEELKKDKVLVIYLKDCHESIAGIIAGRLRERYDRPVLVLTKAEKGVKGSGRSIEAYSMAEEIGKCKELLLGFGGHPMAAGFSLEEENIEAFRKKLNENTTLKEEDLVGKCTCDMVLPFCEITPSLIREFSLLEPYGKGNTKPVFAVRQAELRRAVIIGKNKNMLRLLVKQENSQNYTALLFRQFEEFKERLAEKYGSGAFESLLAGRPGGYFMDFLFCPDINEYNGYENIQLILEEFR